MVAGGGRVSLSVEFVPAPAVVAEGFFMTAERLQMLDEPLRNSIPVATNEVEMNFAMEGRPTKWEDLAEGTAMIRGSDHPILDRTGTLRSEAGQEWAFRRHDSHTVSAEMIDPTGYGAFHITGTNAPMPIRDWSYVSEDGVDAIQAVFMDWLEEAIAT